MANPLAKMTAPVSALIGKHMGAEFLPRLKQNVIGLAEDFWADGPVNLFDLSLKQPKKNKPATDTPNRRPSFTEVRHENSNVILWHAEPGEISEKMWGESFVTPGDEAVNNLLIRPLGLTNAMSVLDLSAGLGGRMRLTTEQTGAYITGLEPDAGIAERGMRLSIRAGKAKRAAIRHYDPAHLVLDRTYDCVIARETFYRVPDRPTFFTAIAKHTKPQGQIAFTDYILDAEHREKPAIKAWKANEKLANPMGLVETAEEWSKVGFNLRIHEDLSDFYKSEVMDGMKRIMAFLASGVKPDMETAGAVLRRIETWKYRLAAMENGMKFYRFYGTKR